MKKYQSVLSAGVCLPRISRQKSLSLAVAMVMAGSCYVEMSYAELEEVVVTARKREEGVQDVPIAISAVTGLAMQQQGISDLEAAAPSIPSFHHAQAVTGSDIYIMRGVGTAGSNVGFEQAVGQVVNGVYFGRSRFGRTAFLDIERMEVLKGPQGALIGKNTSAGAINIVSKSPTETFEADVIASYDFEASEGYSVETAVSGPLTDNVRARFAAKLDDRDGWLENNNTGRSEATRDDLTARLTIDFDLTDTVDGRFMYQRGDIHHVGRNREWSACSELNAELIVAQDPKADCDFNGVRSTIFVYNDEVRDEDHETTFDVFTQTFNVNFESATLSSITNFSEYEVDDIWDIDQSTLQRTNEEWHEDFEQFSQEVRLVSSGGEQLDYIAGIYYQTTDLDFQDLISFHRGPASGTRVNYSTQETDSVAIFGQIDWYLSADWTLTIGGRYTEETKDAVAENWYSALYDPQTVLRDSDGTWTEGLPAPGFAALVAGPTIGDDAFRGSLKESKFTPNLSLQWQVAAEQMLYFNYGEGFKGGGFDLQGTRTNTADPDIWLFDLETSSHFELGGKHTLADNTFRFNWALFHTEFDDMQVSSLDGLNLVQITTNAATAISEGFEVEIKWAPTAEFNLGFSAAYVNAEFDSFTTAPCWSGQTSEQGCSEIDLNGDEVADGSVQDLSGVQLQFAPELQYTIDADYTFSLASGLELTFAAQYYWVDDMFLNLDHDPLDYQESYSKINARINLSGQEGRWNVALVGRNLTDEYTSGFGNDTGALAAGPDAFGTHFSFLDETRAVGLQFSYNYY